jgi:glycosyltransferase involved in cell wall biosynthesis
MKSHFLTNNTSTRTSLISSLEGALWAGDCSVIDELNVLWSSSDWHERSYAAWVLARWYSSQGHWRQARVFLDTLLLNCGNLSELSSSAVFLLSVSILLKVREYDLVEELLIQSRSLDAESPDFALASASFFFSTNCSSGLKSLSDVYARNGLARVSLNTNSTVNLFDHIECSCPFKSSDSALISVIVPAYNAEDTILTSISSLQKQSWQNIEIIVVDDCSSDSTNQIVSGLARLDSRIKILRHHVNQGVYVARNTGLRYARGDYITVHDADDYSHCQKIEKQVKALEKNKYFKASVSHWARCDDNLVFGSLRQEDSWVHRNVSSLMFRREVFEDLGFWDCVSINADTEYYYRILKRYGKTAIKEVMPGVPLAFGRMQENSLTQRSETHWRTQFGGVRKEYMDAAHEWHNNVASLEELYLSDRPESRPFKAPSLICRKALTLGESYIPYFLGQKTVTTSSKRVLLCGHLASEEIFGAERSLIDMARGLSEKGWYVVISLPREPTDTYKSTLLEFSAAVVVTPYHWWKSHKEESPYIISKLKEVIEGFEIKVVGVNTLTLLSPCLAAKSCNIPVVMHVRELPEFDPDLCELLESDATGIQEKLSELSVEFVANSKCTAAYLKSIGDTQVLENLVEIGEQKVPWKHVDSAFTYFSLISSNAPKKGVETFLKLAQMAASVVPNARFRLFGPETDFVASLLKGLDLENFEVMGYYQNSLDALEKTDVVLSISDFQESYGRTAAEAMAVGRPVVAYRWGAVPELIENGVDGCLVHYGDVEGLVARVKQLTKDRDYLNQFGDLAKSKIRSLYGFDRYSKRIDQIYSKYIDFSENK